MMTVKNLLLQTTHSLTIAGIPTPEVDAQLILCHYLQITRSDLHLHANNPIPDAITTQIQSAITERCTRKPLQYIIGEVDFLNTKIAVNPSVLIPRPETEFMVDHIITHTNPNTILDICTGSGCIAIALKRHFTHAHVTATDISPQALQTAQQNAENNNTDITFICCDLWLPNDTTKYDLIVSNPPYISENEYATLQPEIFFEPKLALVAKNSGQFLLDSIIRHARDRLSDDGELYVEMGQNVADCVETAHATDYSEVSVIKDLCEKERILRCKK